jgi:hypothetical protein
VQTALAIAAAILLGTSLYLGAGLLDSLGQRDVLSGQLQGLERAFAALTSSPGQSPATEAPFPKAPPGIDLADAIVRAARETGNEVLGFQASAVGSDQIGSSTYRVVKLTLRLRSGPTTLARFFEQVERSGLATLVFDNIDVTSSGDRWDVSVDLLTYALGA